MKGMIFAAGRGTRLRPLTDNTPKALVPVEGIPLIEHVILKLISFGVNELIINIHHHSDQIRKFLHEKNNFNIRVELSDESDVLLDTGGGLKKARWFFNDNKPFIIHNCDVISDINLEEMLSFHQKKSTVATIAVRDRVTKRYWLLDSEARVIGWENISTKELILAHSNIHRYKNYAFSGVHIVNSDLFSFFPDENRFSIVDLYLKIAKTANVFGYIHNYGFWKDYGKIEDFN